MNLEKPVEIPLLDPQRLDITYATHMDSLWVYQSGQIE